MKQLRIVMLGDSLSKQGGIVTLEKLMLEQAPTCIQIRHIGTVIDGSGIRKLLVFIVALAKFVWQLLSTKVDLVHIHVAERGSAYRKAIMTLIAKLLFRKPVILHSNSPEFHLFYKNLPQPIQQWLLWAFSQCDRFIAVSESWKNFYVRDFGLQSKQVIVLVNPIKLPVQVPLRKNSERVRFIGLGRIGQRKGSFDAIEAFAMLPEPKKSQASLILAGDGEVEKARKLVENLNLADCVTIPGWINLEQRDTLLAKADVFVLPTYNEGLPLALLEAMGWGLPAITTPVGGIPDIVIQDRNGFSIEPGNISQLSAAMESLIDSEDLRLALGSHARKSVTYFDVKYYFDRLIDIYDSVLNLRE